MLTVRPKLEKGALVLGIKVLNGLAEPVYFRAHPDDGGRDEVLHGRAYTWLDPEGDTLRVSLLTPPPDPEIDVSQAIISLSRRLEAGADYTSELVLPLPVVEWNPCFAVPESADSEIVEVDAIEVLTGWFPEQGLGWIEEGPEPGTYWTQGAPYKMLKAGGPMRRPFPVQRRLDRFERP